MDILIWDHGTVVYDSTEWLLRKGFLWSENNVYLLISRSYAGFILPCLII